MRNIFLILTLFCTIKTNAQVIELATFKKNWIGIDSNLQYCNSSNLCNASNALKYKTAKSITNKNYSEKHRLFIKVKNSSFLKDSFYFFIGHWVNFSANKLSNAYSLPQRVTAVPLNVTMQPVPMLKMVLEPNELAAFEIIPEIRNFNFNYIQPFLIKEPSLNDFGYFYYFTHQKFYLIFSFIFIGVLVGMFLYAFISWRRERTSEYLYYGIYVSFFIIYFSIRIITMFLSSYSILNHNLFAIHFTQVFGYILYSYFLISFLHLKEKSLLLYRILLIFNYFMLGYLLFDLFLIYFTKYIYITIQLFTLIRYGLLAVSILAVYYLFMQRDRISGYIAKGISMLFLFSLVSLIFTTLDIRKAHFYNFFDIRIPLYQLGIAIELVLFTMALQYKSNLRNKNNILEVENLRIENEKKEFENYIAIIKAKDVERTRIAQEIHDDIGSGLTSIRLLSEIAKAKNSDLKLTEVDKISTSASELIENMNEIIWSINSKNDYLTNLIAYIRQFVVTYFENHDEVVVKTIVTDDIPDMQISGDFRRSIFLVVKESLHNVVKHANATKVLLEINIVNAKLEITITDNGKGFDAANVRQFSNGLKNMRERMESLGGSFSISSEKGSVVRLVIPVYG